MQFFEIAQCAISAAQINKTSAKPGNKSEKSCYGNQQIFIFCLRFAHFELNSVREFNKIDSQNLSKTVARSDI